MSPDPYDGSYDSTNPQSLNRYAYVQNATLTFQDPTGLEASFVCSFCSSVGDFFAGVVDYLAEIFEGGGGGGGGDLFPFGFGSGSGQPGGIIYGGAAGAGGGGIAPNNGKMMMASYNPMNPCSNANPAGLDYSSTNAQQHIMQNHSPGGRGPSFYAGDFAGIQALNGSTLLYGALAPSAFQRTGTYTLQYSVPQPFDFFGITLYIGTGQTGQLTSTNRLVVKTNCSTVITSYPVTP